MLQEFLNATQCSISSSAGVDTGTITAGETTEEVGLPRGVIAPHAGYSYSGLTAAYAYANLREALMRGWSGTVVVLHPSHHTYLDGCAISGTSHIFTLYLHDLTQQNTL